MLLFGSVIVLLISDPMVSVLSEVGARTGISAFYISFVFAPLASNASEVIACYNYAQKKTPSTIAVSISTLQGAAVLNSTFVLGIFLLLVYSQHLIWEFFAETTTILIVQFILGIYSFKKTQTLLDAFIILSFYPLSILLVYLLTLIGWN